MSSIVNANGGLITLESGDGTGTCHFCEGPACTALLADRTCSCPSRRGAASRVRRHDSYAVAEPGERRAYAFGVQRYELPINEAATGSALHGIALWSDWRVEQRSPGRAYPSNSAVFIAAGSSPCML